eukprot:CAMPEP_0178421424 /NCGR_PEP_ID=MMETSP0689_2-20121128/26639_1 /TAXON_ID=160604 /ORGANISM="Amphidinium massartii, Strain CS-259" /LENGTH=280 /DNA_ID=CAMNT_0020042933 /DNA_START=15 /DNA_END=853 /DNA_ORIENTATION=-
MSRPDLSTDALEAVSSVLHRRATSRCRVRRSSSHLILVLSGLACLAASQSCGCFTTLASDLRLSQRAPKRASTVGRRFFGDMFNDEVEGGPPRPEGIDPAEELEPPEGFDATPEGYDEEGKDLPVVKYPHPALRRPNALVMNFDEKLRNLGANLAATMYATGDGIGLAAPQVGVNLRVMVYNPQAHKVKSGEVLYVNPRVVKHGGSFEDMSESCLSFPGLRGPVSRPAWIEVEAQNIEGQFFRRRIEGFEARLFLHEYDHLDGVLYVDRLTGESRQQVEP